MEQLALPFNDLPERIRKYNDFMDFCFKLGYRGSRPKNFTWKQAYEVRQECGVEHLGTFYIKRNPLGGWEETHERP